MVSDPDFPALQDIPPAGRLFMEYPPPTRHERWAQLVKQRFPSFREYFYDTHPVYRGEPSINANKEPLYKIAIHRVKLRLHIAKCERYEKKWCRANGYVRERKVTVTDRLVKVGKSGGYPF